ncbi:hypothetical protein SAMN05421805_12358 [Saccharopolyspora antimicrobica]|uniref:Lipoprotein n=1 Tax=Saccharopolyspora antimicrobica TaxID=455193 RepID=A0A1I5JMK0_9PSEU|nr:hypothetical protein [Saccharopolyspora antimicrobica]RKT84691.1 hypothetical protein ATL45_3015 [Saccharopolyspora antimicrobica]SFO74034.1 hypothetical protein SAMN05421805_12358 [Saccharopolyspora antimicrobica]
MSARTTARLTAAFAVAAAVLATPFTAAAAPADVPDIQWPPVGTTPPNHSPEEIDRIATELQQHAQDVFPDVVPQAVDPTTSKPSLIFDGALYGNTVFRVEEGRTAVTYQYNAPGVIYKSPKQTCEQDNVALCEGTLLDDGSVLLHRIYPEAADDPFRVATSMHFKLDGSVTMVSSYSYDPIIDDQQDPNPRPEVAVPFDQLDVLATDPDLAYR